MRSTASRTACIDDPTRCKFDPGVLECKGEDAATCLTKAQAQTARLIYMSPVNPKTKREITGLAPGSELGWTDLGWTASARSTGLDQFRFIVFKDPKLGRRQVQLRDRHRARGGDRRRHDQRARSEPQGVLRSRRQADSVSRLERSADLARQQRPVLQARRRGERRRGEGAGVAPAVHGARHGRTAAAAKGRTRFDMVAALEQWVEQKQGAGADPRVAQHATARSIARGRSARIRRSRATRAPAAPTRRRTSPARPGRAGAAGGLVGQVAEGPETG